MSFYVQERRAKLTKVHHTIANIAQDFQHKNKTNIEGKENIYTQKFSLPSLGTGTDTACLFVCTLTGRMIMMFIIIKACKTSS